MPAPGHKGRNAGFDQGALDEAARAGFANGAFEESAEEGVAVVEEFYPEGDGEPGGTAGTEIKVALADKLRHKAARLNSADGTAAPA